MNFIETFNLNISTAVAERLLVSVVAIIVLSVLRFMIMKLLRNRISDDQKVYHLCRATHNTYLVLLLIILGSIWFKGIASLGTVLGLAGAGLAVALHDVIANVAGFFLIESRKPFRVGDRVQSGDVCGDVIDIRLFQFTVEEVGNWVDADQSTGRIVHIPNWKVFSEPLANYHIGFAYIWNEMAVSLTFESDWRAAKEAFLKIAKKHGTQFSNEAETQVREAAQDYHLIYEGLEPSVTTSVKNGSITLTIRYVVDPRQRRSSEQHIWEDVLDVVLGSDTIEFIRNEPPTGESDGDNQNMRDRIPERVDEIF